MTARLEMSYLQNARNSTFLDSPFFQKDIKMVLEGALVENGTGTGWMFIRDGLEYVKWVDPGIEAI